MKYYPHLLITLSVVGLLASSILMNDTVKLAANPDVELPCNINPLLSCTSIATKWQSHVFGFPNPILGIISFSMLIALGLSLIYHVIPEDDHPTSLKLREARRYFWTLVNYGTLASLLFVGWFAYQSIYNIGSLCLYCMIVWSVTWPIFLYTTVWNIKEGHFSFNKVHRGLDNFLTKNHLKLLVAWYLLLALLVFIQFKDFFLY